MPETKPFRLLREEMDRRDPSARPRVEAIKQEMELAELRESLDVTQKELATALEVTQGNVSRIERRDDVYLSTLSNYLAALGGHLEVSAIFPDRTVILTVPAQTGAEEAPRRLD